MRVRTIHTLAALLVASAPLLAQNAAPRDHPSVAIAGKQVAVEYGQPSLGGRSFDELMKQLPPDRMWRTGSEQVTTLTTETDVLVGDAKVPAGKYSLYVHVGDGDDYALAVNSALGQPLGRIWAQAPENLKNEPWPHFKYAEEIADKEVARVPLRKVAATQTLDRFTMTLVPAGEGATLTLAWGDRAWAVDIKPAR